MTTEVTAAYLLLQEANSGGRLAAQDVGLAGFHRIHHGGSNVRLVGVGVSVLPEQRRVDIE